MRLLNPSPGEILDRLSILELKIAASKKLDRDSTHFEAEKASLDEVFRNWENGLIEDCCGDEDMYDKKRETIAYNRNGLAAINALLWQAEDNVRETPDTSVFKLAILCKQIVRLNDARAKFVRQLDLLYGIKDGPEKLHMVAK
jgi:hypothetical protein